MKLYGLIGYPLSHSFSGTYFANKFLREGITDAQYKLFPLSHIGQLKELLSENPDLAGLNVTIPYKQQVIAYLNEIDEAAKEIGAVNTLKIERSQGKTLLRGFNTDVYGFAESFNTLLESREERSTALILGTGGAAKAIEWALTRMGFDVVYVSRNPSKPGHISYPDVSESLLRQTTLIVNASPAGMFPHLDECPDIPYQFITDRHILYDLIYNPEETMFMKKGKEQGAKTKNGLQMLHLQADKAWEIWMQPSH